MLIQFSVENYLSIREKVFLSLEPSADKEHPENIITQGGNRAVSGIAIYGANASGKSNIFKAITFALNMIRNSNNVQVTDSLPVIPFKFDRESKNKPTSFEFTFIAKDEKKYIYGFRMTREKIVEEYLYYYASVKPSLIFDVSESEEPKFIRSHKSKLEAAYRMNTSKKLFLATATSWNVECTRAPYEWLAESMETFTDVAGMSGVALKKYQEDENDEYVSFTKELLKQADINISSIHVDAKELPSLAYHVEVKTGHKVKGIDGREEEFTLGLQEESLGTQQIFYYGPFLKDAFEKGKTLVLDEIDKSLHPSIVRFIVNLFRDPDVNTMGAQLIAITHETGLLTLDLFRRDQIYFTEKDTETGVTDLYSLDEFPVRKTENIEKGYLMGRYGAIPFLQTEEVL
ncbi:MAG: ATP-binding protein [Lachnospiraceae bacterium]|nr:ATP-binding protein [Lachnospiraceae bacterium]